MDERSRIAGLLAALGLVAALALTLVRSQNAWAAPQDWNDAGITWMPYEAGLAQARQSHRPICLVFHTTWCPHCANYARVFNDPRVVAKARSFVMIRVDNDKNPQVSSRYSPDGQYIPRTFFLTPDGKLDESIAVARPKYRYFYDEQDPTALLAGMERALKKLQ